MIHSRNLVANGHVLDGFGCAKMSRWICDNRRNRGSIVDACEGWRNDVREVCQRSRDGYFRLVVAWEPSLSSSWLMCRRRVFCWSREEGREVSTWKRSAFADTRSLNFREERDTNLPEYFTEDGRFAWRVTSAQNICVNEILLLCSKKSILIIGGGSRWKDDDKVTVTTNSNTNS